MTEQEWLVSVDPMAMLDLRHWHGPRSKFTDRKLRLFAVSCCRQVRDKLVHDAPCAVCHGMGFAYIDLAHGCTIPCEACSGTGRVNRSRRAVEVAERFADGEATIEELSAAETAAFQRWSELVNQPESVMASDAASCCRPQADWAAAEVASEEHAIPPAVKAALLRDVVGNPFQPVLLTPPEPPNTFEALDVLAESLRHPERKYFWPRWRALTVVSLATAIYEERAFDRMPQLGDALEDAGCEDETILRHCRNEEKCFWCHGTRRRPRWGDSDADEADYPCNQCKTGWLSLRGPHVRGCWVVDLVLGKE